jgi:hypothetical protein
VVPHIAACETRQRAWKVLGVTPKRLFQQNLPIPDLPNATAHCAKRTIANPPAIGFIAGHAIERAARHLKFCRPMGVSTANHQMPLQREEYANADFCTKLLHFANCA